MMAILVVIVVVAAGAERGVEGSAPLQGGRLRGHSYLHHQGSVAAIYMSHIVKQAASDRRGTSAKGPVC